MLVLIPVIHEKSNMKFVFAPSLPSHHEQTDDQL